MLTSEFRQVVSRFADDKIEINQLEEWYVSRLPSLLSSPWSDDAELVADIELGLAEFNNDTMTESELRELLAGALAKSTTITASFYIEPTSNTTVAYSSSDIIYVNNPTMTVVSN